MANTIRIKRSAVAGKTPTVSDLDLGELALNTYDGKLYAKRDNGIPSVVKLGGGGEPITETAQVISSDLTLSTGFNGLSVGPIEVGATFTVTVPSDATWAIV
jgi:hypothetical protein